MSKQDKVEKINREKSAAARAIMIATGVSIGVALSFFVMIGKGIKSTVKAIEGLKDSDGQ